jgi:hypothetical protein
VPLKFQLILPIWKIVRILNLATAVCDGNGYSRLVREFASPLRLHSTRPLTTFSAKGAVKKHGLFVNSHLARLSSRVNAKLSLFRASLRCPFLIAIPIFDNAHSVRGAIPSSNICVIIGRRVAPVALVAGLVIMVLILLYTAFNRAHEASPQTPAPRQTHQR